jgi:putative acetyltransferase
MLKLVQITEEGTELDEARQLFREYEKELDADLCFQSFEKELENPLYKYGQPQGSLILAYWNNEPAGCVALQPLEEGACEMKRLFVRPSYRQHKIGEALVVEILEQAKLLGYSKIKLDTLQRLQAAIHIYKKHGFEITTAYYSNPLDEVVYMSKSFY